MDNLEHIYSKNEDLGRLLNAISDGIIAINSDYTISWHNEILRTLFDLPQDTAGKKCYEILFGVSEPCEICPKRRVLETGEHFSTTIAINENTTYAFNVHCVKDEMGAPIGILESITDISEQERTKAYEEQARAKAEIINNQKSQFFANISHEIRTPLNAIIGFSELLTRLDLDFQQRNYVNAIVKAGNGLLTIVNDILDLSKMEAEQLQLHLAPVDLHELLSDTAEIFQALANEKQLYLDIVLDSVDDAFLLDEARTRQILINIIGNALKFTDEGGVTITVKSFDLYNETHSDILISIADTGRGIDPVFMEKMFSIYTQDQESAPQLAAGTGLGLSISKKLVEKIGGEISVESAVGEGSTFSIRLSNIEKAITTHSMSNDFEQMYFPSKVKILVVDDVESNRYFLSELLGDAGATVHLAENGLIAVEMAERLKPDLIIMDIRMPVLGGIAATHRIKSNSDLKNIPIIAFTASAKDEEITNIKQHFDGYLAKPASQIDLYNELRKHVKIHSKNPSDNTDEQHGNIYKLVKEFNSEELLQWQQLVKQYENCSNFIVLNEIYEFSSALKDVSEKLEMDILSKIAEKIDALCVVFDFQGIEEFLKTIKPIFLTSK